MSLNAITTSKYRNDVELEDGYKMIVELLKHNLFMTGIFSVALISIFLQWLMMLSLKGYVKASANMKTTKKKVMINLKNQFEAMHEMNSQVRNMDAYVDKYLLKLRFMGVTYSGWENMPFLTAGIIALIACAGAFYGYSTGEPGMYYAQIMFSLGISLACLFVFFHIFGIKTRKQQIHIQLVDYLDNYLANRLNKNSYSKDQWASIDEEMEKAFLEGKREALKEAMEAVNDDESDIDGTSNKEYAYRTSDNKQAVEEDMDMLKRLIKEMDSRRGEEPEKVSNEVAAAAEEQSDIELLEEFVQSFLS